MSLRRVSNPEPYIACVLAAGEAKDRMTWAELTDAERAEARRLRHQGVKLSEAADIVRRSRR